MLETRFEAVKRILNTATDQITPGRPNHGGQRRFWDGTRDALVNAVVYGQQVIVLGKPEESALIKSLKGVAPFDGSQFPRMPLGRPPVNDSDIAFIAEWIRDNCPDSVAEAREKT